MRSVDEDSTVAVASSLLNAGTVPLEEMPELGTALLKRRMLPGPSNTDFNSSV